MIKLEDNPVKIYLNSYVKYDLQNQTILPLVFILSFKCIQRFESLQISYTPSITQNAKTSFLLFFSFLFTYFFFSFLLVFVFLKINLWFPYSLISCSFFKFLLLYFEFEGGRKSQKHSNYKIFGITWLRC